MIEKWHERSNGLAFKIIFALVSLSFVLGGIGGGLLLGDTGVVKVNGESISQQAFNNARNRQQEVLNQQMGARFWDLMDTPEYAAKFNNSVLNSLINNELLRQYAKELKLGISAEQVKAEIVNTPNFHRDGKFDNNLYLQTLRNNGINSDQYAAIVSEGMLMSQIEEGIINTQFELPIQQELLAKLLFQQRKVRIATLELAKNVENQTASTEELQAYYDANKAKLLTPEQLAVEYVLISPKDVANRVQITDDQIATYYEKNRDQYVTKGEARLAHIQVTNEADAKAVAQELANGADFAKLAKAKSVDKLSANQGGDLGWAKAGTFPKAFEEAANALTAGQVSSPVNVDGAYHIIKVLERKNEEAIPLEKAKEAISTIIRKELEATEYSTVTREMANAAFENSGSLENVAKVAGAELKKTATFTRETVPAELQNEAVVKALFEGDLRQTNQNSEALEVGDGTNSRTMFVRVSQYQPEREKGFDEAKAEIENAVKTEKAEKALLAQADKEVKALAEGKGTTTFGDAQNLVYAQIIVQNPLLANSVFTMPKPTDKATYQVARNEKGDVLIVALDKITEGTMADFQMVAEQFAQAERAVLRDDLLKDLRERASIEINQDVLDQLVTPNN